MRNALAILAATAGIAAAVWLHQYTRLVPIAHLGSVYAGAQGSIDVHPKWADPAAVASVGLGLAIAAALIGTRRTRSA
jgi:hypothetical protein